MRQRRAGLTQRTVLWLEPSRRAATMIYSIVVLIMLAASSAAQLYGTSTWPRSWHVTPEPSDRTRMIVSLVTAGFAVLALLAAVVNARRWRVARAVQRLSNSPHVAGLLPDVRPSPPRAIAPVVVAPVITFCRPGKLPRPRAPRPVTAVTNVIGRRPLHIGYLRLFDNQPRSRTFVQGAWREFGWVHMLRSATSITPREYRAGRHDLGRFFVSTPGQLLARLGASARPPLPGGRRAFRDLGATTIRTRDRYGSYPTDAFLCHGAFWREAVDIILSRVDLVVLDLSGLTDRNRGGTGYEIQRVIDVFPAERVVFLADTRSNWRFLEQELHRAWSRMAAGSPNAGPRQRYLLVGITDRLRHSTSTSTTYGANGQVQSSSSTTRTDLVARRTETRRLAAYVQETIYG